MEALQRLHNRGSISTGYDIDNSVKLEDANSEWLYRASPTAGNRRTYTFSFWIKRTELGAVNASGNQFMIGQGQHGRMYFGSEYFQYRFDDGHDCRNVSRQFRDTSAWYHFVVAVDTNQSSSSNRVKLYVNGESLAVDDHDGGSFPDIQDQGAFFSTSYLTIGTAPFGGSYNVGDGAYDMSGYLSEFCGIDGTQYAPTDFGEFDSDSGIWKPKDLSDITWGSEGYYLKFDDSSDLGADSSGNGNNFTLNNISAADQATDTPTNNFCTFNPLQTVTGKWLVSNGATSVIQAADYGYLTHAGNMGFKKGKWYAEFKAGTNTVQAGVGMNQLDNTGAWETNYIGAYANATAIGMCKSQDGYFYRNGGSGALGVSWAAGDILGIAIRINDDGTGFMGMSKNGTWENSQDPSSGTSGMIGLYYGNPLPDNLFHSFAIWTRRNNGAMIANFGGFPGFTVSSANTDANGYGSFEYAVPTGYYALCTKNLEEFG